MGAGAGALLLVLLLAGPGLGARPVGGTRWTPPFAATIALNRSSNATTGCGENATPLTEVGAANGSFRGSVGTAFDTYRVSSTCSGTAWSRATEATLGPAVIANATGTWNLSVHWQVSWEAWVECLSGTTYYPLSTTARASLRLFASVYDATNHSWAIPSPVSVPVFSHASCTASGTWAWSGSGTGQVLSLHLTVPVIAGHCYRFYDGMQLVAYLAGNYSALNCGRIACANPGAYVWVAPLPGASSLGARLLSIRAS